MNLTGEAWNLQNFSNNVSILSHPGALYVHTIVYGAYHGVWCILWSLRALHGWKHAVTWAAYFATIVTYWSVRFMKLAPQGKDFAWVLLNSTTCRMGNTSPFLEGFVGATHPISRTPPFSKQARQGILKGEVSLYHWPPVWLVWNQLYDNWQLLFLFAKQTHPKQSNRRSTWQGYFLL
jgi:hypothetical protein